MVVPTIVYWERLMSSSQVDIFFILQKHATVLLLVFWKVTNHAHLLFHPPLPPTPPPCSCHRFLAPVFSFYHLRNLMAFVDMAGGLMQFLLTGSITVQHKLITQLEQMDIYDMWCQFRLKKMQHFYHLWRTWSILQFKIMVWLTLNINMKINPGVYI